MNSIEITDSRERMEEIGRQILAEKADKYNGAMMDKIGACIDKYMPDASPEEKEQRKFRSVYNYWVYGNDTDEDFYFGFDQKTISKRANI